MSILRVKELYQSFGQKEVFKDVNFELRKGEHIGLIGSNGHGKSTFMKIIAKKEEPTLGEVIWNKDILVGYMDQHAELDKKLTVREFLKKAFDHMFVLEQKMIGYYENTENLSDEKIDENMEKAGIIQDQLYHGDFYEIDVKIEKVSVGLGINEFGWDKLISDLSGGQRTKLLLAKLLLENPEVLLLDEPTNFLDENHIEWLQQYLLNYENAFILISHELEFLNPLVNVICHVENKNIVRYTGNYDLFVKTFEMNQNKLVSSYVKQQKQISDIQTFIDKNSARASTSKRAKSKQKALDKIERIELNEKTQVPNFTFKEDRKPSKVVLETKDLVIGYEKPLTKPLNLTIERGSKIAIIGTNGLGKTTLLKSLINLNKPISGDTGLGQFLEIGYFEQESKKSSLTCLEDVWESFDEEFKNHKSVRGALARVGLTKNHIESKISVLSGGEQAKVKLCKLINKPSNFLILDEPTNHLDKVAKEELRKAIRDYKGTILIVSHEPEFYKDLVDQIWNCESWSIG